MEIKIKNEDGFLDDGGKKSEIVLNKGEAIIVRGEDESYYMEIVCDAEGKILITTNFTFDMERYNLVKASQRLLGKPVKKCKCGDARGGLPHLHPLYIPFEFED